MPNYITQILSVMDPSNRFDTHAREEFIRTHLLTEHGDVDLNKIIPVPDELQIESSIMNSPCTRLYATRMIANGFDDHQVADQFMKHLQVVADYFHMAPAAFLIRADEEECFIETHQLNDDIAAHIEFGKQCFNNIVKYGFMTWLDFTTAMWGTKWNAHDTFANDDEVIFTTPGRPAVEAIDALAEQYPEYVFVMYYIGENVEDSMCGRYKWRNGRQVDQEFFEPGSTEAYEIAFELGVECIEDYDFDGIGYHRRELDF